MNQSVAPSADVVFRDALGERRRMTDSTGHDAELLCLSAELTNVAAVEPTLTRTVSRLAEFRHAAFPKVRSVERFDPTTLAVVSDAVRGVRLSQLLASIAEKGIALELNAALCITRQLLSAIEALHAFDRDIAHGALGPERVIINSNAKAIVADYVFGPALEQLRYSHQHYWKSLRIGLPRSAGATRFDHGVDILQIGSVALALILGRLLKDDEYSAKLVDVVNTTLAPGAGDVMPHKSELRDWLLRAIQCDPNHSFSSAIEAGAVLDSIQSEEERAAGLASLERVLMRHHGVAPPPVVVKTTVAPAPVEPQPAPIVKPFIAPAVEPPMAPVVKPFVAPAPVEPPAPIVVRPFVAAAPVEPPTPAPAPKPFVAMPAVEPVVAAFVKPAVAPPPPSDITHAPAVKPLAVRPFEAAVQPLAASIESHAPVPVQIAPLSPSRRVSETGHGWQHVAAATVAIAVLIGGGFFMVRRRALASGLAVPSGTLTVQSNPSGARLEIDGKPSGFTPATLTVASGTHSVVLHGAGDPKTLSVTVAAGAQVSQYIELPRSAATVGGLLVRTEPAGALVTVDRVARGASPATVSELSPGDHTVVVSADGVSVEQTVNIAPGVTSSLIVPLVGHDRSLLSGWIAVSSPIDVQIYEDGRLLGSNQTDRLMMSAGEHHLDFVNDALGYRSTRKLNVAPGKVDTVSLKLPSGSIAVNAVPWAEVWIDGEKAGDTPIGNIQTTIGKHEVVFRHPELGETRQSVTVTLLGPARLSVDMRKK